jgi:MOSC domain-containing protein YiiM
VVSTRELINHIPQQGRVEWIGLRPERHAPVEAVSEVLAREGTGLEGDRFNTKGGGRQVTLIQAEHIAVVASLLGRAELAPSLLRRNLVVAGINLFALRNQRFTVGEALFEGTGHCHPCSLMEEALGSGGFAAMRGHGGITARVLRTAPIRLGDTVVRVEGLSPSIDEVER